MPPKSSSAMNKGKSSPQQRPVKDFDKLNGEINNLGSVDLTSIIRFEQTFSESVKKSFTLLSQAPTPKPTS